jgi:hypothetical protein
MEAAVYSTGSVGGRGMGNGMGPRRALARSKPVPGRGIVLPTGSPYLAESVQNLEL